MLIHYLISNILFPYFITGVVVSITIDTIIRRLQSGTPFTFSEIWTCILLWPIFVKAFIKGYIGGEN